MDTFLKDLILFFRVVLSTKTLTVPLPTSLCSLELNRQREMSFANLKHSLLHYCERVGLK